MYDREFVENRMCLDVSLLVSSELNGFTGNNFKRGLKMAVARIFSVGLGSKSAVILIEH